MPAAHHPHWPPCRSAAPTQSKRSRGFRCTRTGQRPTHYAALRWRLPMPAASMYWCPPELALSASTTRVSLKIAFWDLRLSDLTS